MARGVNKVFLLGELGNEPTVSATRSGGTVAACSLVVSEDNENPVRGKPETSTQWHRLIFFGRPAEYAARVLHKGTRIFVEGRLRTRSYQDKKGSTRYVTEVVCSDVLELENDPPS